jgi:hypothetical protein
MSPDSIVGLVIIGLLFLLMLSTWGYIIFRWYYPVYNHQVLDTIKYYKNWQWINPIPANEKPNIPFIFDILPEKKLRLAYYDSAGYFKGFSTFIMNYTIVDDNTLQLTLDNTIANYSQKTLSLPWTLTFIDSSHLSYKTPGTSQILELL